MTDTPKEDSNPPKPIVPSDEDAGASDKEKTDVPPAKKRTTHRRQHRGHGGIWLLLVAIGIIAAGVFYGMQFIQKTDRQTTEQLSELTQSQQSLAAQTQRFADEVSAELDTVQSRQDDLTKYVEVLRDQSKHLRKDWLVKEAEYLVQLANYRLLFERDIKTAIVALTAADTRLKDTGDPALLKVRQAISDSVHALKQVEQVDLAGLSLTLSAVNKDLGKLPLNMPDPVSRENAVGVELSEAKQVTDWTELPAAMWRDIKNLIVIRDHEQPIGPLLSPDQRFFLVENLRLQLEQARLAMLSGQAEVYKERLQTAIEWVEAHYDKEAALTRSTLENLRQLSSTNIAPALPDISATYQAMQAYRTNGAQQVAPAKPESNGSK